jgi:hypothetical protein
MSEISTPVTAVKVSYKCDECGVGEMKMSGTMLPSLPPQYGHSCDHCGTRNNFRETYPRIEYVTNKEQA